MNFKNIFTAAVIATATLCVADVVTPQKAQAGGCYPSLAAQTIANMIRGGASKDMAIQAAVNKGEIGNEACFYEVIGHMRSRSIYSDVLR